MQIDELMFRPGLMRDQRILITGGGTGLGRLMAQACLMLDARVYICGRRANVLEQTATELVQEHGGDVVPMAAGTNPLGRAGKPHELANLAVYLLAPGSEYVNGQTIAIDGAQYQANGGNLASLRAWDDAQWASARAGIKRRDNADRGVQSIQT